MSSEISALLERLAAEPTTPIVRRVRTLLASPVARITSAGKEPVPASVLEPTWRARKKVAALRHKRFFGISGVLEMLKKPNTLIDLVAVMDERESGLLFFDATSNRFLGAVVVVMSQHTRDFHAGRLQNPPQFDGAEFAQTA